MTTKERKAAARVFLGAAELLETANNAWIFGCCSAIESQGAHYSTVMDAKEIFKETFDDAQDLPEHAGVPYWFRERGENIDSPELKNRRILGLCLAAHLVEIGEIG